VKNSGWFAATVLALSLGTGAAQSPGVVQRGESHEGMGFSQATTTHHFLLTRSGGIIQVTAKDPQNTEQIATVQMHLKHIVAMFSAGDFSVPHFVHDTTTPGAATMKRLRSSIRYTSETMENGGRIRIDTDSTEARNAIHDFLRFQIKDHETGDPLAVSN
jgi:TusA-related sulfurtransferase